MEELKRRILSDAVVGEGDIIHVDMFLNHCMDINLMEHRGNALAKRFRGVRITKVLTAESSGIALACFVARAWMSRRSMRRSSRPGTSIRRSTRPKPTPSLWRSPIPCGSLKSTWTGTTWFSW